MAFHPFPFLVALVLVQAIAGCSSPVPPPVSATPASDSADQTAPNSPSSAANTAIGPEPAEAPKPVVVADSPAWDQARDLRPPLFLDDYVDDLIHALPDGATLGYVVMDLPSGDIIAERDADRERIPASTAKLATALVALQRLGAAHRYRTELLAAGPIDRGVLQGDLILKGGGDPFLDIPDLVSLIDGLASRNVHSITGRFLIDDTALPRLAQIESTQPAEAPYNPGLGALSVAFNRVTLRWNHGAGLAAETVPRLDEASFVSAASDRLPPSGVQLRSLAGGDAVWQLADRGPRRSGRSLPVKDAGLHAGQVFADLARLYGIDLPPPERGEPDAVIRTLSVHESRPLRDLVRNMLWYSNNLMAELIGLSAAKAITPEPSSLETSADVILATLKQDMADLSWQHARLVNHSGLSSANRLTPRHLAAILHRGWSDGTLRTILPGSGWSGTLAKRLDEPNQALRIWAKTGSINYVAGLAGYLLSSAYGPAAFAIMISDENARRSYDAQPSRTREGEKRARAWLRKTEGVMDRIVGRWLEPMAARRRQQITSTLPDGQG